MKSPNLTIQKSQRKVNGKFTPWHRVAVTLQDTEDREDLYSCQKEKTGERVSQTADFPTETVDSRGGRQDLPAGKNRTATPEWQTH